MEEPIVSSSGMLPPQKTCNRVLTDLESWRMSEKKSGNFIWGQWKYWTLNFRCKEHEYHCTAVVIWRSNVTVTKYGILSKILYYTMMTDAEGAEPTAISSHNYVVNDHRLPHLLVISKSANFVVTNERERVKFCLKWSNRWKHQKWYMKWTWDVSSIASWICPRHRPDVEYLNNNHEWEASSQQSADINVVTAQSVSLSTTNNHLTHFNHVKWLKKFTNNHNNVWIVSAYKCSNFTLITSKISPKDSHVLGVYLQ